MTTTRQRWFQFSLRGLLAGMTAICGLLGALWHFEIAPAERQRSAVYAVRQLGGQVLYGSSPEDSSWPVRQLRRWLPRDYFDPVGYINLDNTEAADDDVAHLCELRQLRTLYLRGTLVTDTGIAQLRGLRDLTILDLSGTAMTDLGLDQLQEHHNLWALYLDETAVTDTGLVRLAEHFELRELSLRETMVTDAGLVHLSTLPRLHGLDLAGTRVTDAGVAKFQQTGREYVIIRK